MLTTVAFGLAIVISLAIGAIGVRFLVAPRVADAVIVLRNGGTRATAFGIHVSTAVLVLADAVLLLIAA